MPSRAVYPITGTMSIWFRYEAASGVTAVSTDESGGGGGMWRRAAISGRAVLWRLQL